MKTNYQIEKSSKFKTNYLQVRYIVDANKSNITMAALLSMYLIYSNNVHKTYKEANDYLDQLYGSKIDVNVGLKGKDLVFDFILSCVSNKYLKDEKYLEKIITSFLDYIFRPLQNENEFSSEVFELKKYELIERIKSAYDDKVTYAIEEFLEVFASEYPLSLNTNGYIEILDEASPSKLKDFYLDLVAKTPLVGGNVDSFDYEAIVNYLEKEIPQSKYDNKFEIYQIENHKVDEKIERQELSQSKLVIGYTFKTKFDFKDYYTYLILNTLLGLTSTSYLFKIVREKENLCYTIRSNHDLYSNSIMILAGIEKDNYNITIKLVEDIIKDMKDGKISAEDLNDAKLVVIDMLNKIKDSQSGLVNYSFNRLLQGQQASLENDLTMIKKVQIDEVVKLMQQLELKTKYLLSGEINE